MWHENLGFVFDAEVCIVAIGVKDNEVDFSSNCGNMTSAIGPFAVDNGLVDMVGEQEGEKKVRIYNTNTGKMIYSSFSMTGGEAASSGSFAMDGVAGTAARIRLDFLEPG